MTAPVSGRGKTRRQLRGERVGEWHRDASCAQADPEAWFPDKGMAAPRQVFTVCAACPVQRSCLATALLHHEHGVWAGTTADDRRGLQRLLRVGVSVAAVLDLALANQQALSGEREVA